MSVSLLRQATLKHPACCLSSVFPSRRLYAAQAALARKFVDHVDSEHNGNVNYAAAEASTRAKNLGAKKSTDGKRRGLKKSSKIKESGDTLVSPEDPWQPTGVELYLTEIQQSGPDPTLQDIERCRPETHAENVDSMQYSDEYNALLDKLCRSFSRQQLRAFTILYKLDLRAIRAKIEYAEAIIEKQWGWPSLKEAQKRLRDRTEVSVKTFPVNPVQLFLLLGRDGTEMLQMSIDYNVHIAVTRSPLALRVEGLRGPLKALSKHIAAVKNAIVEETIHIPGGKPIKQELVQPISRLADAYVDNLGGKDTVRICAKHERNLSLAKRLVTRASLESQESFRTPLLSYLPTAAANATSLPRALFPQTYSVYPFLSSRSLPWTMKSGGAFRVRRVVEWLGVDDHENIEMTGGLAGGKGRILSMTEDELDLKNTLLSQLPELRADSGASRVITASFGHILLPSSTTSQRASIVPPFKGFWPFMKILRWMETSRTDTSFVPSLPIQLLNSAPKQQKFLVRLWYRVLSDSSDGGQRDLAHSKPTRMMKFEVVLAQSRPEATPPDFSQSEEESGSLFADEDGVISFADSSEIARGLQSDLSSLEEQSPATSEVEASTLSQPISDSHDASPVFGGQVEQDTAAEASHEGLIGEDRLTSPRCWAGVETAANLILPDRPMDIHFAAFDSTPLSRDEEPEQLTAYASALQAYLQGDAQPAAPPAPSTFTYNGETYFLHKSSSVRQGTEVIPDDSSSATSDASTQLVSESILDMESQQKSTTCEISCHDHVSEESWKVFLGICDHLTPVCYNSAGSEGLKETGPGLGLDID